MWLPFPDTGKSVGHRGPGQRHRVGFWASACRCPSDIPTDVKEGVGRSRLKFRRGTVGRCLYSVALTAVDGETVEGAGGDREGARPGMGQSSI